MPSLFLPGFEAVPDNKKIDTMKFLDGCEKIPMIFDILGGKVFYPVKNDVVGNIQKIKKRFLENPVVFATLDDIIAAEMKETNKKLKAKDGNGIATNALMWLKRGLKFILLFLEHLIKKDYDAENLENLKPCARLAYKGSLQDYHGWMVSQLVTAATNALPYRTDLLKSLSQCEELTEEETLERAAEFLVNYRATVDVVYELFNETGVEKFHKV